MNGVGKNGIRWNTLRQVIRQWDETEKMFGVFSKQETSKGPHRRIIYNKTKK
jgi:hypothetical protein